MATQVASRAARVARSRKPGPPLPEGLSIGKYVLGHRIGWGAYGDVYTGWNARTSADVAIKLEIPADRRTPRLPVEARVYTELRDAPGFARMLWYGEAQDRNALVMERLGPSLWSRGGATQTLGAQDVHQVGLDALVCLEQMHSRGWLHLDVKPTNFLRPRHGSTGASAASGPARDGRGLRCIDFGMSRRWLDPESGTVVPPTPRRGVIGTVRFASVSNQLACPVGPRDDLESLGYMLVYLTRGALPWCGVRGSTKQERFQLMLECKQRTALRELCEGIPAVGELLKQAAAMPHDAPLDFAALRALLQEGMRAEESARRP